MASWMEPKSLEKRAAWVVARSIFRSVRERVRRSETRLKLNNISKQEHIDNITSFLSQSEGWWMSLPGCRGSVGNTLKAAMDNATELCPSKVWKGMDYLLALTLKLLLLDAVIIDRDYANTCGLCLIPVALENTAQAVLGCYRFPVRKLTIYGAMYPSIVQIIIERSHGIKFLAISQVNLTDELMDSVALCRELEVIHLMHSCIWLAVSTNALCRGFFRYASESLVSDCFKKGKNVSLSFPNLKVVDIGHCTNKFILPFYRWVLYFYDLHSVCLNWKTTILEENEKFNAEKAILPLIKKGKLLHLESLYLNAELISKLPATTRKLIVESMPHLNQLYLDCEFRNTYQEKGTVIGEKMKIFAQKLGSISKLHVNISSNEQQFLSIMLPFFKDFGRNLTSITVASEFQGQHISVKTLKNIMIMCPNVTQLKLLFLTRFSLRYDDSEDGKTSDLPNTKLTELWLHELSPWNIEQDLRHEKHSQNWMALLNSLLESSPLLEVLSVSVCEAMSELLLELQSRVTSLHLHVKDGCEWNIDVRILINLVKRLINLNHLYLEELDGDTFWEIATYLQESNLTIHWGNMAEWPRS